MWIFHFFDKPTTSREGFEFANFFWQANNWNSKKKKKCEFAIFVWQANIWNDKQTSGEGSWK